MKNLILIVDDDLLTLRITSVLLRAKGYEVRTTDRATGIFDIITTHEPSLIILDVNLPDGDGREICRQLKTSHITQSLPVIICSGLSDLEECYEQVGPPDVVLQKPFDIGLFLRKVGENLPLAA